MGSEFEEMAQIECEDTIAAVVLGAAQMQCIVDDASAPASSRSLFEDVAIVFQLQSNAMTVSQNAFKEAECL